MIRPENTHPHDQDVVIRDSDNLEGATPLQNDVPAESPSSFADAGLVENAELVDADADFDEAPRSREINMTDLLNPSDEEGLHSPVMSDLSAPGEIDIEELDEDALADTDIPRDALLDPLEP
ncbi:MAG: hypothetical protein KY445_03745 [Armatimonadetes bacterium]|nr:hypothetical protein [Armatimonadota bacterium]